MSLQAPFPYFGGKRTVARQVRQRFGKVKQYLDPLCGSLAVLLEDEPAGQETVGDLNLYIANFWRSVKNQPDAVADAADYPVIHIEQTARHRWLCEPERVAELRESLMDPEWHGDAKIAGWWVWGQCCWIGQGWCSGSQGNNGKVPHTFNRGNGINAARGRDQVPVSDISGKGVHSHRLRDQVPFTSRIGAGVHKVANRGAIHRLMNELSVRLRHVVVINGDWTRCLNSYYGRGSGQVTAIFFDPPYLSFERLYRDSEPVACAVEMWCREHGDTEGLRIALCGHAGDYDLPGWDCVQWSRDSCTYGSVKTKEMKLITLLALCCAVLKAGEGFYRRVTWGAESGGWIALEPVSCEWIRNSLQWLTCPIPDEKSMRRLVEGVVERRQMFVGVE